MPWSFSTTHAWETWQSIQDIFNHSKISARFPDNGNPWQMGHNSWEDCFLGEELLLDFAAWIDLTPNTDTSILLVVRTSESSFCFFKTCWWPMDLSRLYDASQPPGRQECRYFKKYTSIVSWHTGDPNTASAVKIYVPLFTCVPVSFLVV